MAYEWNKNYICINPTVDQVRIKDSYRAKVFYAEYAGTWHGGIELVYGHNSCSSLPSRISKHWSKPGKDELIRELWIDMRDRLKRILGHPESLNLYKPDLVEKLLAKVEDRVEEQRVGQTELFA